jgi:hypothetical protein
MSSIPDSRRWTFFDDLRLEAAVPVARHGDLDRADIGQYRLRPGAVARVPAVFAGRIVFLIAEMVSDLAVQGGLDHPLGQLLQQASFTGQLQARCAGLLDQPAHQLGIHALRRDRRILLLDHRSSIHGGLTRHGHQMSP